MTTRPCAVNGCPSDAPPGRRWCQTHAVAMRAEWKAQEVAVYGSTSAARRARRRSLEARHLHGATS